LRRPIVLPVYPAVLLMWLYRDVFLTRESIFTHDSIHWYGAFSYFILCLADGHLPLWDPYSFSGAPYYLNHNIVGALDPTVLIAVPLLWLNVSALDIYHLHFLARLLIMYGGAFALFRYVSRNDWASLLGATIFLFVMAPNSFWQHGSTLIVSYAPLIMLFLLRILSPETPGESKGLLFIAACYLTGLSFSLYLPTYLYFYLSVAILYLLISRAIKLRDFVVIYRQIGLLRLFVGLLIFAAMSGPFFYSLSKLLPAKGESFSYTRYETNPQSQIPVHTESIHVEKASSTWGRGSIHNVAALFLPGVDKRFFFMGERLSAENFLSLGFVPVILIFVFFRSAKSPYKGLLLFQTLVILVYYFGSERFYAVFLKFYPGIQSIRQLHNFMGFMLVAACSLISVCFAGFLDEVAEKKMSSKSSLVWLILLFVGHLAAIYWYLLYVHELANQEQFYQFLDETKEIVFGHGWLMLASYVVLGLFFIDKRKSARVFYGLALVGFTSFHLFIFNSYLKPLVAQPGLGARNGDMHYYKKFAYQPIRVPFVPRYAGFWGYLPSLYRIPVAIPSAPNSYMSLNRRNYDYIRLTSFERQRIISGIGAKRFGFFDHFVAARDSVQALDLIGRMPVERLRDTLVLEENPAEIIPELKGKLPAGQIDPETLALDKKLKMASLQRIAEFYDQTVEFDYSSGVVNPDGFLEIPIESSKAELLWPWDKERIGYFQVMLGPIKTDLNYLLFKYYSDPELRLLDGGKRFCYIDFPGCIHKGASNDYSDSIYNHALRSCDIERRGDKIFVSPELQQEGRFSPTALDPQKVNLKKKSPDERPQLRQAEKFFIAVLDPKKVDAKKSPYERDESEEVVAFGPNEVQFSIKNSKSGFFYYADSYAEDWRAFLDDKPTHLFAADFQFKAVWVPEGAHTLRFTYSPRGYIFLMAIFIVVSIPGMLLPVLALRRDGARPPASASR
jgi:hypothetical protein